jgi:DNA-binding response OmpR family regulator
MACFEQVYKIKNLIDVGSWSAIDMSTKVILFADNDIDFLDSRSEFLENEGFIILKASSPEKAREFLDHRRVNLAILDIRLTDDKEGDISGLELAQDSAYNSLPKIMMTGFPTVDDAKLSLRRIVDELPPAVDYISKKGSAGKDGRKELIEVVKLAFDKYVRINWDLVIQWDSRDHLSFFQLSRLIYPGLSDEFLVQRAEELEDLIRKLFFDHQRIRLGRLLWHDQEQFCLPVLTQSSKFTTDLRILVCSDREGRKRQQEHNERLAPDILQRTELRDKSETIHFGANLYELRGAYTETVQTLRDLFQGNRERPLKTAFAHLLNDVLKPWHQHGQKIEEKLDLMSLYRQWLGLSENHILRTEVTQRIEALCQSVSTLEGIQIEWINEQIIFRAPSGLTGNLPDPVAKVYKDLPQYNSPIVCRISPGKLTADNILLDAKSQVWLTDFGHANQAPQWWDFVCLEATIRFDLSHAPDFIAWQEYEECLLKPNRLDEGLEQNEVIPELRTNVALIEQIRRQAASEAGPNSLPYYAGLLAWIVEAMVHYDPGVLYTEDRLRGAHLLLAACMVADRLGTLADISLPEGTLYLDANDRVWLGERKVAALIGLRLKLLKYLIEIKGQVVSNQTITEDVYGEKYTLGNQDQNQRIRQEISRLREEIEPDPSRPRYLLTERGKGYRLKANGKPEE